MALNVDILESSFSALAPKGEELAKAFYERLFNNNPELKPLFVHRDNSMKLFEALKCIVNRLRDQEALVNFLKTLGARHVSYNIKDEDYPKVGTALLETFEEFAGDLWTEEVKQAWTEAYELIATVMKQGAAELVSVETCPS